MLTAHRPLSFAHRHCRAAPVGRIRLLDGAATWKSSIDRVTWP